MVGIRRRAVREVVEVVVVVDGEGFGEGRLGSGRSLGRRRTSSG